MDKERLLTLDDIRYIWELIQRWHILKYVERRCRLGLEAYVAEASKKEKKKEIPKDVRDKVVDTGLSSDEESDEEDLPAFKRKNMSSTKKKKIKKKNENEFQIENQETTTVINNTDDVKDVNSINVDGQGEIANFR
jgi:hypothetical protein